MITDGSLEILKREAILASRAAYCPYSGFAVGAAVLTGDGRVFAACNVESASYGLTICAERNAVFQAVAKGARQIDGVVIYTPTPTPACPCGACRQVLNEFGPEADAVSFCEGPGVIRRKVSDLLPDAFGHADLLEPV